MARSTLPPPRPSASKQNIGNWFKSFEPEFHDVLYTSSCEYEYETNLTQNACRKPNMINKEVTNINPDSSHVSYSQNKHILQASSRASSRNVEKLCHAQSVTKSDVSFIVNSVADYARVLHWDDKDYTLQSVHLVNLSPHTSEYQQIQQMFCDTNKNRFNVTNIERIQNPYLLSAFLLKREEMESRIGYQKIEELFHGTKRDYVMSICTNNFDWRLCGENKGNTFGQGVSFTGIANYATFYGDGGLNNRVMLLALVLVGKECIGSSDMILPDNGTDTSIKDNRDVIVKYEDNEFYPTYKITYSYTKRQKLKRRK